MVTDQDRALAEFIIDPAIAEHIELVPAVVEGVECALLADVTVHSGHVAIRPVAIVVNRELLQRLTVHGGATIIDTEE